MRVTNMSKYIKINAIDNLIDAGLDLDQVTSVKIEDLKDGQYINNLNKHIKHICLSLTFDYAYLNTFKNKNPLLNYLFDFSTAKVCIERFTPKFLSFIENHYQVHYITEDYDDERSYIVMSQVHNYAVDFLTYDGIAAFHKNKFYISRVKAYDIIPFDEKRNKDLEKLFSDNRNYGESRYGEKNTFKHLAYRVLHHIMRNANRYADPHLGQHYIYDELVMEMTYFGYTLHKSGQSNPFYETTNLNKVAEYITNHYLLTHERYEKLKKMLEN